MAEARVEAPVFGIVLRPPVRTALMAIMALALVAHVGIHVGSLWGGGETYAFLTATVVLTAFCLASATHLLGWRGALRFLLIGVLFGWLFEYLGVTRGFLFGHYYYTDILGPKLGPVPYAIPPVWFDVVYVSFVLANLIVAQAPRGGDTVGRILLLSLVTSFITTAYDLCLDPFMVDRIGAWVMAHRGPYFSEPLRGFAGWVLVSGMISLAARFALRSIPRPSDDDVSPLAIAMPLVVYAVWCLFFAILGFPKGTRPIALFAMGIPVLAAYCGWMRWRSDRTALQTGRSPWSI